MTTHKYDIEDLSLKLVDNIDIVLDKLKIYDITERTKRSVIMPCPVHGGDNPNGFSLLLKGVGNWQCYTHRCHEKYGNSKGASVLALIQAVMNIDFDKALSWAANILDVKAIPVEEVESNREKLSFISLCKNITPSGDNEAPSFPREQFQKNLKIPAEFFKKKGYKVNILERYDVGECFTVGKPMYNRAVVPLYDISGKFAVGCTGRSIFEQCPKCKLYHNHIHSCPINSYEKQNCSKWRNSSFNADSYIYNLWNALPFIKATNTIILVEGAGDVWKLEEAEIHNGCSLLGVKFTRNQKEILQKLPILNVVIGTDNDEAGKEARERIRQECSKMWNVYDIYSTKKDFGEMETDELRKVFTNDKDIGYVWR